MKIEIRESNVAISSTLKAHIECRLVLTLRRFSDVIDQIVVRLVDLNGPKKGGLDKRCRITAHLATTRHSRPFTVLVEATDGDAYVAITQATARLAAQIARQMRRRVELDSSSNVLSWETEAEERASAWERGFDVDRSAEGRAR
jgi:putative sigma-54 modulation protein